MLFKSTIPILAKAKPLNIIPLKLQINESVNLTK